MTAYDLYRYFEAALDYYMDSIAIKEDPTDKERKQYENIKYWRPSAPDDEVKEILESIVFASNQENEPKE